MIDMDNI